MPDRIESSNPASWLAGSPAAQRASARAGEGCRHYDALVKRGVGEYFLGRRGLFVTLGMVLVVAAAGVAAAAYFASRGESSHNPSYRFGVRMMDRVIEDELGGIGADGVPSKACRLLLTGLHPAPPNYDLDDAISGCVDEATVLRASS